MPFERELEGRVAVITGAGRSIGRAMAIELANAGCNVVVNVRSNRAEGEEVVKAVEKAGGRGMVGVADVIDPKAVNAMVDAALQKFGRIDYLVNNAALRQEKSIEHLTFEDWRKVIGITLDGAFHCVKACLESIKKSDAGSIITTRSIPSAETTLQRPSAISSQWSSDASTPRAFRFATYPRAARISATSAWM